jgi:hypothetical protein
MNKDMTYEQIFATSRDRMEEIMKEVHEKYKNDTMFEHALLNDPTETLKKEGLKLQPDIAFKLLKQKKRQNCYQIMLSHYILEINKIYYRWNI